MFKKTQKMQGDIFKSISAHYSERKLKLMNDPAGWHNVFFNQVYNRIDEDIFKVLYSDNNGRSNASVRVLVSMMILKEGMDWSDRQLFEQCEFNALVMLALGMSNADQDIPVASTYYKFRSDLLKHKQEAGVDLFERCFRDITVSQVQAFGVGGDKIRMDSKLISSNVARGSRLSLMLDVLKAFIKNQEISLYADLTQKQHTFLQELKTMRVNKICYLLDKAGVKAMILDLGIIISKIIESSSDQGVDEGLVNLKRLFGDHFEVDEQVFKLKEAKDVLASSLQSPHDPDCTFRSKGSGRFKQEKVGFHSNVTETCDGDLNLITDITTAPANVSESDFFIQAVDKSQDILRQADQMDDDKVNQVISDGGYDSLDNREKVSNLDQVDWVLLKTKGKKSCFDMSYNEDGLLEVREISSGNLLKVTKSRDQKKVIVTYKGSKRYFTQDQIKQHIYRSQYSKPIDDHLKGLRANCESTIHAMFHCLGKRDKVKYRGLFKCNCYVLCRALWINCSRIKKNITLNNFFPAYYFFLLANKIKKTPIQVPSATLGVRG